MRHRIPVVVLAAVLGCVTVRAGDGTGLDAQRTRQFRAALSAFRVAQASVYTLGDKHVAVAGDRYVLVTDEFAQVRGYAGPSVLGILLKSGGDVVGVAVLTTPDTPAYYKQVEKVLRTLERQKLDTSPRPVLAVSGATRSSHGFTETVNRTLDAAAALLRDVRIEKGALLVDGKPASPLVVLKSSDGHDTQGTRHGTRSGGERP